jgi:integrase
VLNHALEDELIDVVPKLKILKGANTRKWVLPVEQEQKYLDACTEPLRTVAIIMLDAGLRPNEVFRLRWSDIQWTDAKRAFINVPGTKTVSAERKVPMTSRLRGIIRNQWESAGKPTDDWVFPAKKSSTGHIVDNTVYEPHKNAVENSGIKERQFVLYALRHTCLTKWGASGMDAWTLARLAGHSNIRQSMTYVHPRTQHIENAIQIASSSAIAEGGDEIRDNAESTFSESDTELAVISSSEKP